MRLRVYLPESTFDWPSPGASFRVGRGDTCALVFTGESAKYASWEHAEFSTNDGVAYVTDLGSSNGTYVDGVRIAEATALWIGATVQIGGKGPRLEVLELTAAAPRPLPLANPGVPPAQFRSVGVPPAQPIVIAQQQPTRPHHKLAPRHLALLATTGLIVIAGVFLASRATTNRDRPSAGSSPSRSPTKTGGNRRQKTTDSRNIVAPDPPTQPPLNPVPPPSRPWTTRGKLPKSRACPLTG